MSVVKRGNYYKSKTKRYFESLGYVTEYLEKIQYFRKTSLSPTIFYKKDLFGSDGLSLGHREIIFWNSKYVKTKELKSWKAIINKAAKEFDRYPFPRSDLIKLYIIIWTLRAKSPKVYDIRLKKLLTV